MMPVSDFITEIVTRPRDVIAFFNQCIQVGRTGDTVPLFGCYVLFAWSCTSARSLRGSRQVKLACGDEVVRRL